MTTPDQDNPFGYWVLDAEHSPVRATVKEWGVFFSSPAKVVGYDKVGMAYVSTVFLGINAGFFAEPPLLFETMIFGGEHDGYQERYATWRQAECGHEQACAKIRGNHN